MPIKKTLKEAERYGNKHCFIPEIKAKYSKKHGTFLGYEVKDMYDVTHPHTSNGKNEK